MVYHFYLDIVNYCAVEEFEFIFLKNLKPIILKGGEKFGELPTPIKSIIHHSFSNFKICNKWASISENNNRLAYVTDKNDLLSFTIKDLRKNSVKPQQEAFNVADFIFDQDLLAILYVDGKSRFGDVLGTGEWINLESIWTTILKLDKCWLLIGWDLTKEGNHYITIDFDGQLKEKGYLKAQSQNTRNIL